MRTLPLGAIFGFCVLPLSINALNSAVPNAFLSRRDSCSDPGSKNCGVNIGGTSFCCPASTDCIPLQSHSSAICCNTNTFCDEIKPIDCGSSTSSGPTPTSSTTSCGSQCCPAGFKCSGSGDKATCRMTDDNLPPNYKTHRASQSAAAKKTCEEFMPCPEFPARAVVTGFFPGIVVGVGIMFLYTYMTTYRLNRRSIKSFGQFRGMGGLPDDDNAGFHDFEPVEKITRRPSSTPAPATRQSVIQIGFSPNQDTTIWSAPLTPPARPEPSPNLSPNLGPTIPRRDRSRSASRDEALDDILIERGGAKPPSRLQYSSSAESSERGSMASQALQETTPRGRGPSRPMSLELENGYFVAPASSLGPFGLDDDVPRGRYI